MRIDIATLFPDMCDNALSESIIGRARKNGLIEIHTHNIRDYSEDKHRRVDDTPYGGGMGMVMKADPIYKCYLDVVQMLGGKKPHVIYMSPQGEVLRQEKCKSLLLHENVFILCGHYEGVDERIIEKIVDEEISIGDYVLTGGELAAMVLVDSVARLCDGVLSDNVCFEDESHYSGLLEYPQYTRPETWEESEVPKVLLSGHHANINAWRHEKSLERTKEKRPDMYGNYLIKSHDDK